MNYFFKKTDEISPKEYIFDTKLDKILNDKEKLDCDGEVTDTECSEAIGNMKLNKSPGLDGLTVEFYRAFWGKLKIVLTDIYNKSYNEALMSYFSLSFKILSNFVSKIYSFDEILSVFFRCIKFFIVVLNCVKYFPLFFNNFIVF
jgi:hypothetical protein